MGTTMPYVLLLDPSARWSQDFGVTLVALDPGWACLCASGFLSALRVIAGAGCVPRAVVVDADLACDAVSWLQRRLARDDASVPLLVALTENLTLLPALHDRGNTIALAMPTTQAGMRRLVRTVLRVLHGGALGGTSAFSRRVACGWHAQRGAG